MTRFILSALLLVAAGADDITFEAGIEFANPAGESLKLDLARPKTQTGKGPAVLCIHGGGFRAGKREGWDGRCKLLAEHGYVAATVTYRLAPKYPFPAAVEDVKAAVRWLRANAGTYSIDPERIGVVGDSAGGHLAQFLGVTGGVARFEGDGGNPSFSSRVSCVVNYYGPSDLTKSYGKSVDAAEVLPLWLGGDDTKEHERHVLASPLNWATPAAAPTLLLQGTEDKYVNHEQAVWMRDKLKANQVEVEMISFEGAGHGFKGADAERAWKAALDFFDRHLKKPASPAPAAKKAAYELGPDSKPQEGVPEGKVLDGRWESTKIYPGTVRDYKIYLPAKVDPDHAPCLMVFQDGGGYADPKGSFRTPTVFDNLIHKGDMPPTIGVFVNPGVIPGARPGAAGRQNRSFEYDQLGDQYARFLLEEFLPGIAERHSLKWTDDPDGHAISGISSGGICAFTVAWERPDYFRKVLSHVGSFTNIRGGDVYPGLIRKTEAKPLRVFLQDGSSDLDNVHGSWPLANQSMAAALKYMKYDYKFEFGTEGHSGRHGGSILPDSLRWLWRDYKSK